VQPAHQTDGRRNLLLQKHLATTPQESTCASLSPWRAQLANLARSESTGSAIPLKIKEITRLVRI